MKVQGRKKFVSRWYAVQGAWVAPRNTRHPTSVTTAVWSFFFKWLVRNYGDPAEKCLYRLSRPLEVTGTDPDRSATYDFLLVFHSNYRPISYRFRDIGQSIFARFSHPRAFNTPTNWNFCNGVWAQKPRMMPLYQTVKRSRYVHSFRHNSHTVSK